MASSIHGPVEKSGNRLPTADTASGDRFVFSLSLKNGLAQLVVDDNGIGHLA
jgi:hypothetical protein